MTVTGAETFLKTIKNIPICLQISHSGRKGSCNVPWVKSGRPLNKNGWKTISSSNLKRDKNWPSPIKANIKDIKRIGNSKFGDGFLANLKIFKALLIGIIKFR